MKFKGLALAAASAAIAFATPASALRINLNDIGGVTGSPAEMGFTAAKRYWENVLTNDAVVNFNVGFSSLGPGILGGTGSNLATYVPVDFYKYALAATGTTNLDAVAVANLAPTSATGSLTVLVPEYDDILLKMGIAASGSRIAPDDTAISATLALSTANLKALFGRNPILDGITDAEIQFSSDFDFDFNPLDGIDAGKYDFIGVAVHEMGHALGFISGADDFDYSVGPGGSVDDYWWGYGLDMFRYSAPGVLDWTFGTDSYFSIDGGFTQFNGKSGFSTGENYGDGWQASHWKTPNSPPYCSGLIGIMNPYICDGTSDAVTGTDLALFDAIGWNPNVDVLANPTYAFDTGQMYAAYVPEPAQWTLMLGGFGLLGGALRRRKASVRVTYA